MNQEWKPNLGMPGKDPLSEVKGAGKSLGMSGELRCSRAAKGRVHRSPRTASAPSSNHMVPYESSCLWHCLPPT